MPRYRGAKKPPAQKKPPLTHFLCLPLVTPESKPQLEASLQQFRDAAVIKDRRSSTRQVDKDDRDAENQHDEGDLRVVHPKAIRPVGALHCTLGVMSLSSDGLRAAVETLEGLDFRSLLTNAGGQSSDEQTNSKVNASAMAVQHMPADAPPSTLHRTISPPPTVRPDVAPLTIDLRGLVSMHSPKKTSILYSAPKDSSERLYPFCRAVQKVFKDKDLLVADDRDLKLHATIVNTIYAKGKKRWPPRQAEECTSEADLQAGGAEDGQEEDRSTGHGPNANAPLKIDASSILEKFAGFVWAESVTIDRIAICEMGAKKVLSAEGLVISEEYTEVACLALHPN